MNQQDFPHTQNQERQYDNGQQGAQRPMDSYAMYGGQEFLPNSTGVMVIGILSIVTCFCYGLPGLVLAIIALIMGNKAKKLVEADPDRYSISSVKNMKAGYVCAIIGLVLSALTVVFMIIYFIFIGTMISNPNFLQEMFNQ
jgi:hypothetical protein